LPTEKQSAARASTTTLPARPQLLLFGESECSACARMRPAVTELDAQYGTRATFRYIDVSDPDSAAVVAQYRIAGSPTVIILDSAGHLTARFAGQVPKADVEAKLREVLDSGSL
jgi:thioredoxin-like negative regulator of GroEL